MNVRGSTIELLMQGIQDEVARRRAQIVHDDAPVANPIGDLRIGDIAAAVSGVDPEVIPPQTIHLNLTLPEHMPVGRVFQQNPDAAYDLNDFSAYDDVEFIDAAFRAILKREPDEGGLKTYLAMLRDGALRAELLADFVKVLKEGCNAPASEGYRYPTHWMLFPDGRSLGE